MKFRNCVGRRDRNMQSPSKLVFFVGLHSELLSTLLRDQSNLFRPPLLPTSMNTFPRHLPDHPYAYPKLFSLHSLRVLAHRRGLVAGSRNQTQGPRSKQPRHNRPTPPDRVPFSLRLILELPETLTMEREITESEGPRISTKLTRLRYRVFSSAGQL